MAFQVLINFNEKKNKPLDVADSSEKFNNTSIRELKEEFRTLLPGAPVPVYIEVGMGYNGAKGTPEGKCVFHYSYTLRKKATKVVTRVVPYPDHLRVFFGREPLEDHQTLEFYKITHLSVLFIVMKMPIGKGAAQSDPDLQFLQSLLPGLKRMDLKEREHTKHKMQQLVFGAEFSDPNTSGKGIRRTDSMERLPPKM